MVSHGRNATVFVRKNIAAFSQKSQLPWSPFAKKIDFAKKSVFAKKVDFVRQNATYVALRGVGRLGELFGFPTINQL